MITKYMSLSEIKLLLPVLERWTVSLNEIDRRNALMFLLLIHTGCRASELLNMQKSSINTDNGTVLIKGLKGSNDREIPLPEEVFSSLLNYSVHKSVLFDIGYKQLFKIWASTRRSLGIKHKLHSLRHTYAIELYRRTKDIRLVQYVLGHRSVVNTEVYQQYVYTQDELRKALIKKAAV